MSGIWALVPFKGSAGAKQRLREHLSESERQQLVLAMLRDVLATLAAHPGLGGVLLVSGSPEAPAIAAEFGAEVFRESATTNLPGAVVEASEYLSREHGADGTLFVPGDVPLITAADLDQVLDGHIDVTLVPDGNDVGTNCAVSSPPNAFEYVFDGKSFKPHSTNARAAGIEPRIVRTPGFALDIDTVDELTALVEAGQPSRTLDFLRSSGVAKRLGG